MAISSLVRPYMAETWRSISRYFALVSPSRARLIQILLKTHKYFTYIFRPAEVGNRVGNGVAILQAEQRCKFVLVKLVNSNANVMGQDEVQEGLLLTVEARSDGQLRPASALFAGERRQSVRNVREHVKEVALLGVDDALHFD